MKSRRAYVGKPISRGIKAIGSLGVREVVIVIGVTLLVFKVVFALEVVPLSVRLVIALLLGIVATVFVMDRSRGVPLERHLFNTFKDRFAPKHFRHQTAQEIDNAQRGEEDALASAPSIEPPKHVPIFKAAGGYPSPGWADMNFGFFFPNI